jgi:hypothetical protein
MTAPEVVIITGPIEVTGLASRTPGASLRGSSARVGAPTVRKPRASLSGRSATIENME